MGTQRGQPHHDTPKRAKVRGTCEFLEQHDRLGQGGNKFPKQEGFDYFGVSSSQGHKILKSRLENDHLELAPAVDEVPLGSDPDALRLNHDPRFQEPRHAPIKSTACQDAQHVNDDLHNTNSPDRAGNGTIGDAGHPTQQNGADNTVRGRPTREEKPPISRNEQENETHVMQEPSSRHTPEPESPIAWTRAGEKATTERAAAPPEPPTPSPGNTKTKTRKRSQGNIQDGPSPSRKRAKTRGKTTTTEDDDDDDDPEGVGQGAAETDQDQDQESP